MIVLPIEDQKTFMKYLLIDDLFDAFELMHGTITTYNTFDIDGQIQKDFYGPEYDASEMYGYNYTPWSKAKELSYQLIKGKFTPISFKFVLRASDSLKSKILEPIAPIERDHISSLILNIRFDSQGMSIVTGIAQNSFSMDKTASEEWDNWVIHFIQGKL